MAKTKIEYLDQCWNFYPGCKNGCSYCWARNRAVRFNKSDFEPKLKPELLLEPLKIKKASKIGVCFTGDLFGDWVDPHQVIHPEVFDAGQFSREARNWSLDILVKEIINHCPQHTFIFLTKQPRNLAKWSPFPPNAWIGLSVDGTPNAPLHRIYNGFDKVKATVKFLSFEPLLAQTKLDPRDLDWAGISWVIIGACTPHSKRTEPKISWIREIVEAADKAAIPVFLKDNLKPLLCNTINGQDIIESHNLWAFKYFKLRQEFPGDTR